MITPHIFYITSYSDRRIGFNIGYSLLITVKIQVQGLKHDVLKDKKLGSIFLSLVIGMCYGLVSVP